MDNFKVIYQILKTLEKAMDYDEFDFTVLSAENLGITPERLNNLLIQMQNKGYIEGLKIYSFMNGNGIFKVRQPINPKITINGLEYLNENSMMKKVAGLAKGIVDIVI